MTAGAPETTAPPSGSGAPVGRPRPTLLGVLLDAVLDTVVWSLALWTLLYCVGLATQWSLWPSGWLWAVASVVILAAEVRRGLRADGTGDTDRTDRGPHRASTGSDPRLRWLLVAGLLLLAAAVVGGLVWTPATFRATWAAALGSLLLLAAWSFLGGRLASSVPPGPAAAGHGPTGAGRRRVATPSEAGVVVLALGAAVLGSLIHLPDVDDPYYVNRSVWVAERGNAALADTMFSPERFVSPYGGGIPVASIEGLFGVVAHMTGLLAGTVTWVVAVPVFSFLVVLAMWRLACRWAPRRAFASLVLALVFLVLSGDSMLGNFFVGRIWQGKVIAVAMLMPLLWAWLTELAETRGTGAEAVRTRRRLLALLLAGGVAFFGLTPTAIVLAPFVLAAALAVAVVQRSPVVAAGGVAAFVGPVLSGLAVIAFSTDVGGADPVPLTARRSFVRVLGDHGWMVALALIALCLAVLLARRGAPAAFAGAAATISVLAFAPGVLGLINAVTGSGPILWRLLFLAPVPSLVGLAATVSWSDVRGWWPRRPPAEEGDEGGEADRPAPRGLAVAAAVAPVLAVLVLLGLGGAPVWSTPSYSGIRPELRSGPSWKVDTPALRDVEAAVDAGLDGEVLMPPRRMKVLTQYTVAAFPVVPRDWFVTNIDEPKGAHQARRLLADLAAGELTDPPGRRIGKSLDRLGVDLVCVGETRTQKSLAVLAKVGWAADPTRLGTMSCVGQGR